MTAEEKAAADAAAKAAADAKAKEEEKEETEEEVDEEVKAPTPEQFKALQTKLAKANAEGKDKRLKLKALEAEKEKQDRALAILQGKDKPDLDPIVAAKAVGDAKLRNAMLKAALAVSAKDAHDPGLLLSSFGGRFKEVTVDIDTESVDEDELSAVVTQLRKDKPFLFAAEDKTEPNVIGKESGGKKMPDGKGQPTTGTNHRAAWNKMLEQGRQAEAAAYYAKYANEIRRQMT